MTALQQAAKLNKEGVYLLATGDCIGAIREFQRGAAVIEKHCVVLKDTSKQHIGASSFCYTTKAPRSRSIERSGAPLAGMQDELFFVFDRPLHLPYVDNDSAVLIGRSVLLFNQGLACHSYGKRKASRGLIERASQFYSIAFRTLCHSQYEDGVACVIKCLALNNLAQLHFEEYNFKESQFYMQKMYRIVRTGCLDESLASQYLSKQDTDELKLNLLCLKKPTIAKAA